MVICGFYCRFKRNFCNGILEKKCMFLNISEVMMLIVVRMVIIEYRKSLVLIRYFILFWVWNLEFIF